MNADKMKRQADWFRLLQSKPGPSINDLIDIIVSVKSLRMKAWEKLCDMGPSRKNLYYIIDRVSSLREKAWEKLLEVGPSKDDLLCVIIRAGSSCKRAWMRLRKEAWKRLRKTEPSSDCLAYIVNYIEPLRAQAWKLLCEVGPSRENLESIARTADKPLSTLAQSMLESIGEETGVAMARLVA